MHVDACNKVPKAAKMLYHQSKMNIFFSKFYGSSSDLFINDDGLGFFVLFKDFRTLEIKSAQQLEFKLQQLFVLRPLVMLNIS